MKKLLILLAFTYGTVQGQTPPSLSLFSAVGQTQIKAYVKYVVDSAFKVQSGVDMVQNGRLAKVESSITALQLNDTIFFDKRFFTVSGRNVNFNIDSVAKYIKVPAPVVDLSAINTAISLLDGRVNLVETGVSSAVTRLNSLEGWRTNAITDLKNINAAILKIPKTATSTSTSTTQTTTTTTLQ